MPHLWLLHIRLIFFRAYTKWHYRTSRLQLCMKWENWMKNFPEATLIPAALVLLWLVAVYHLSHRESDLPDFDLAPFWHTERHLLVNIASSENTWNSRKDLFKTIHVYILHMTTKLEYFGKKIEFSLESLYKLQFQLFFKFREVWKFCYF